ncbi:hypothetical protein AACH06_25355 [Ideonella sp. DXS29W]|uniref:Secreted protein n=1 Tax=Ideonella lacteola TaxID=2984193 RepID=A0ABU9BW15_9BURK
MNGRPLHPWLWIGLTLSGLVCTPPTLAEDDNAGGGTGGSSQSGQKSDDDSGDYNDQVDTVSDAVEDVAKLVDAAGTLNGAYEGLAGSDREAQRAFDADSGPTVPSSCLEQAACNACFGPAVEKIDFNRYWLLRARILTVNTVKVGKAGLSMLEAVSGAAQAAGPVLQAHERPAIENRMATLRAKYEEKAAIYLSGLEAGMRALGECEANHFGTRDWYQRYGYLYVSFMRERFAKAPE